MTASGTPNACGIPRVNGAIGEPLEGPVWVDDTNTQFLSLRVRALRVSTVSTEISVRPVSGKVSFG